jgi:hypothetical protein
VSRPAIKRWIAVRDERCVEEVLQIPLDQYGHIAQLRVSTPIEPTLGEKRKRVPEHLGDLPSRSKLGNEVRFIAHDLKCVRSPRRNCDLGPSLDDSRSGQALAHAKCAVAHEKSLLLARVPMKRPSVATTARLNLRPQEVPARIQHHDVQIDAGTINNITGGNPLALRISGRGHRGSDAG